MSDAPYIEQTGNIELQTSINISSKARKDKKKAGDENTEETSEENDHPRNCATKEECCAAIADAYRSDKDLNIKINYITLGKIRYFSFSNAVNGQSADDVVQNVMELIIAGKRNWDKDKFPNVINYLIAAIHSYVRNESKKKQKWKSEDIYDENGNLKEDQIEKFLREAIAADISEDFFKEKLEGLITELLHTLEPDLNAYCVCDEILKNDTVEMNNEILAKRLGLTLQEVKLAKRKIKYRTNQIIIK